MATTSITTTELFGPQVPLSEIQAETSRDGCIHLEQSITFEHPSPQTSATTKNNKEGWTVVAASFSIFFVYLGITYSFGIVQLHLAKMHLAKVSTLSFIGSLAAAISPFGATIVARIIRKIGHRATACLGGFLVGLGEFTSSWATHSVPALFITQGLLFGLGSGLCFLPTATVPSLWFEKNRGLATGIVYSGAGIGAAVVSLVMDKLIAVVGIENALRILGTAAWIICIPASYFVRPPARSSTAVQEMQWQLFKSVKFCLLFGMGAIATFPLFVAPFLLPLYANAIGLSNGTGALVLAAWNLASAAGRVIMGVGADNLIGPVNSLLFALLVSGVSMMALWTTSTSIGTLLLFAILNGAGSGAFFSLMPVVAGHIFGARLLANALSMLISAWTFGYFMGAPIAGYLLDAYGGEKGGISSFRPAIYYGGSLTLASAGLVLAVRFMINRKLFTKV